MTMLMKGVIRNGRVELGQRSDLPDGTNMVVAQDDSDDAPPTPEEIAATLAAMQQLQPLEIPEDVEADLTEWEKRLNQRGMDYVDPTAEADPV
jgi:hypothetical protein